MKKIILLLLGVLYFTTLAAQNVSNVDFYQSGSNVIIKYDLSKKSDVQIFVSINGGQTYSKALQKVSGAVGQGVAPGKELSIVWDVLSEFNTLQGDQVLFKVTAKVCKSSKAKTSTSEPEKFKFPSRGLVLVNVGVNPGGFSDFTAQHLSYGIMGGWMKRAGFYVKARSNFNFPSTTSTVASEKDIWAQGESSIGELSVTAGAMVGIVKGMCIYAGMGYGSRTLAWKDINNEWVKINSYSPSGFAMDLGLMGVFGKFSVSLGANMILAKKMYIVPELGIGIMF